MKKLYKPACCFLLIVLSISYANAQFSLSGQLRTRAEFRNGQGSPLAHGTDPAFFISQRTRLNFDYSTYRLKFGVVVQDVRVWGQDISTINRTTTQNNNGLMLHEAWAQVSLTDTTNKKESLLVKFGRQELILDDQRLIGNLDWLQQARHHDAAVIRYNRGKWQIIGGAAYNQNKENSSQTIFNAVSPGNYPNNTNGGSMYKSFEFAHATRKLKSGSVSFLFFADQFNKFSVDSANAKTWTKGSSSRFTSGFYYNGQWKRFMVSAAAYLQGGKTPEQKNLQAGMMSASMLYSFNKKIAAGPGFDYTTGGNSGNTSHAFDPLYGTPHKFWGLMDYFYAANSFGNKGLQDYYIKSTATLSSRLKLNADLHQFFSATGVNDLSKNKLSRNFGTELDVVFTYTVTSIIQLDLGYSHFLSEKALTAREVKNVNNARRNNNWAYLMINIKPGLFSK